MDAYDRYTNLGKEILLIVLPSMVEAGNFSDHHRMWTRWRAPSQTLHMQWSKYSMVHRYEIWKAKIADRAGQQIVPDKTECREVLTATGPRW